MRAFLTFLLATMVTLLAAPAMAVASPGAAPTAAGQLPACHAEGTAKEALDAIIANSARWRCDGGEPGLGADMALLSFAIDPAGKLPEFFATRPVLFGSLTLAVVSDGKVVAKEVHPADTLSIDSQGQRFLVPLPAYTGSADSVVVVIAGATTRGMFGDARLHAANPMTSGYETARLLVAAIVCGMLAMPLFFNAACYRVLREKFVLWHIAVTAALLLQCLLTSGVLAHFVDIPVPVFARTSILSFCLAVASAAAFCAAFIEPKKLHPRLRSALYLAAVQVAAVSLVQAFAPNALGPMQTPIYYASFLPVLVIFLAVLVDAWRRGSRAVRYQIVAWVPFLMMGVIRIVTMLVPALHHSEAMDLFHAAMIFQSVATSLGVADRFMMVRRQRDRAVIRAQSLERLSERDALTGLYNRRALDGPLGNFATQGFTGFALFDLDHFKRVNDTHGHATGDAVLRTFANVLGTHENAVAVRMGGEEFLLLLRGDNVAERVERLREAIPVRIARKVSELEMLVTASAGLVEAPARATLSGDFVSMYRAADGLLYEAKHNGRNLLAAMKLSDVTDLHGGGRPDLAAAAI